MIEATKFYENPVLEKPKRLEIEFSILVFQNTKYDKDCQKKISYGRFSLKKIMKEFGAASLEPSETLTATSFQNFFGRLLFVQ